jgi:hypothetical protein
MSGSIMPGFGRYSAEGSIVGRLLTGYGELELELCTCIGTATGDMDVALKNFFSKRGAEKRIERAAKQAGAPYKEVGLETIFQAAIADMDYCREIRNQYAHCNWYDKPDGLGFVDLESVVTLSTPIWPLDSHRLLIDIATLEDQEGFFKYVQRCFWYLDAEYRLRAFGEPAHPWGFPSFFPRPPKHN